MLQSSFVGYLSFEVSKFMSLYRDIICNNGPFEGHLLDGHVTSRLFNAFSTFGSGPVMDTGLQVVKGDII